MKCTIVDSPVILVTTFSPEVGDIGILADTPSAGVSCLRDIGVVSDSTSGASGGRAACVGWVVLVGILTGGGAKGRGWIVGMVRSFGRSTR
jgi:hypothetical protein